MKTPGKQQRISVIGLGQMGQKIAQLYTEGGFEVIVWNRTPGKTKGLGDVKTAASAGDAILASPISIICVYDNKAVDEILGGIPGKSIFSTKVLVNLSTGSPEEAKNFETILRKYGGSYLNGAIQVAPEQMGLPDTTILMAGDKDIFEQTRETLSVLGGNLKHLGNEASASPAMDLATLSWLYGSYMGLMYGVKLCQSFGLSLKDYGTIIGEIVPGFKAFFLHEINTIDQGDFRITQSPLAISVSATQRIADTFKGINVAREFPDIIAEILKEADKSGLGDKELSAIIKVIERK